MGLSAETKGIFWRAVAIVIAMMPFMPANAQVDSFTEKVVGGTKEFVRETEAFIENTLDSKDSIYITPNLYNFTIMPQYSYCYDYYRFSSSETEQSITLTPGSSHKIGLYVGWRWIFLGYSFDVSSNSPQTDLNFSFYTSAVGIDLFYRKRSEGYKIRTLNGFYENATNELKNYNHNFDGLTVTQYHLYAESKKKKENTNEHIYKTNRLRLRKQTYDYQRGESESEVAQLCPTLCDPMDCSLPGSSVHGIFQAIVLEWIAISFSRGYS